MVIYTCLSYLIFKFEIKPCKEHEEINHEQIESSYRDFRALEELRLIKHGFLTIGFMFSKTLLTGVRYISWLLMFQISDQTIQRS